LTTLEVIERRAVDNEPPTMIDDIPRHFGLPSSEPGEIGRLGIGDEDADPNYECNHDDCSQDKPTRARTPIVGSKNARHN
jgi:hypothetical protein